MSYSLYFQTKWYTFLPLWIPPPPLLSISSNNFKVTKSEFFDMMCYILYLIHPGLLELPILRPIPIPPPSPPSPPYRPHPSAFPNLLNWYGPKHIIDYALYTLVQSLVGNIYPPPPPAISDPQSPSSHIQVLYQNILESFIYILWLGHILFDLYLFGLVNISYTSYVFNNL